MDNEVILALIIKYVDQKLSEIPTNSKLKGSRGWQGPQGEAGKDGKDFVLSEHEETIKSFIKEASLKLSDLSPEEFQSLRGPRGLRGQRGETGRDGRGFVFEDHEKQVRDILDSVAEKHRLKFEDLDVHQKEELRGTTGERGEKGKDFVFEDHEEKIKIVIQSLSDKLKLKYSDLTENDIADITGPKGRDGKDFNFTENEERIAVLLRQEIAAISESLKLKYSDLDENDRAELRGAKGDKGDPGKPFIFEEHKDFFQTLRPEFKDFTAEEIDKLKLKYEHLTEEEKDNLKLTFDKLTDEERFSLKGARGQRGRPGIQGERGDKGDTGEIGARGVRGIPGLPGPRGLSGLQGPKGIDGKDVPHVVDVDIEKSNEDFYFVFKFSDGTEFETSKLEIPTSRIKDVFVIGGGLVSAGGGGGGGNGKSAYQIWLDEGNVGSVQDFLDSLIGPAGPAGATGPTGPQGVAGVDGNDGTDGKSAYQIWLDEGNIGTEQDFLDSLVGPPGMDGSGSGSEVLVDVPCETDVYIKSCVRLAAVGSLDSVMSDWTSLAEVYYLNYQNYNTVIAKNGLADSVENSNIIGVVVAKSAPGFCTIRKYGDTQDLFLALDVEDEYYLSATTPGAIMPSGYLDTLEEGQIMLRIGLPVTQKKLSVRIGERTPANGELVEP